MITNATHIELETDSSFRLGAIAMAMAGGKSKSEINRTIIEGRISSLITLPPHLDLDDVLLEGYLEDIGLSYFMARFFETLLLGQGISGTITVKDESADLKVLKWQCPIEFIYTEENHALREEYWKRQEELGDPDSDRILLYVKKAHIDDMIIPLLDTMIDRFNLKKEKDFDTVIRRIILILMSERRFHGIGIEFHTASNKDSSSHNIVKTYKDTAVKLKQRSTQKSPRK